MEQNQSNNAAEATECLVEDTKPTIRMVFVK